MREIKFRGKDILNKNWYYGSLAKDEAQKQYYIINNQYGSGTDVKENRTIHRLKRQKRCGDI